ncbi:hypothetical protein OPT61_g4432 [Boeremia exigua]|uniref:Uncharacterized protein n=1 Tax=Boeremia exigua TaxID=749465 RepID=A0ACC2IEB7_9PLEO|nr:hypothetical protein OPT61_g4432 [Boeremia exigua]
MAGYLALPNELKDLIGLSQTDLSRLSRTSRSMRKALLPQVYKRISLKWEAFRPLPHIWGIFRTVTESPDLAELVEELEFCGKGYREHISNPERERHPTRKNIPEFLFEAKQKIHKTTTGAKLAFNRAVESIGLPADQWKSIPGSNEELDLVIAAMIICCPNLKRLSMGADFLHENRMLPMVLNSFLIRKNGQARALLTKLETVCLAQDIPAYWNRSVGPPMFSLTSCLPFFYLPSIKTLSAPLPDRTGFSRPSSPPTDWPTTIPPTCYIRTLDLQKTRARPTTLAFAFAQMPHLRTLKYDFWCRAGQKLDCAELCNALKIVRHTLTELVISFEPFTTEAEDIDEMGPWTVNAQGLGSLKFLSKLAKLEIAPSILLDWRGEDDTPLRNTLPSSLERLCLRDDCTHYSGMFWDEDAVIEEVRSWLEHKAWKACTPHMKRFGLRLCHAKIEEWGAQPRNVLVDLCKEAGLESWFEKTHPDHEWDAAKGQYEEADNPLNYPLLDTPMYIRERQCWPQTRRKADDRL